MFTSDADPWTIALYAVVDNVMVVSATAAFATVETARSTIVILIVWSRTHEFGTAELKHLTRYCLPQAAPFSHIPSPAAPNMLFVGNIEKSFPKQAVAV